MDWPDYDRTEATQLLAGAITYAALYVVAATALLATLVAGLALLATLAVGGSNWDALLYAGVVAYGAGLITGVNYVVFKVIG